MRFPVHVEGDNLVDVLDRLLNALGSSQQILFDEMSKLTATARSPFMAPTSDVEFPAKRNEIAAILENPSAMRGFETAMRLFEATYLAVELRGGVRGLTPAQLLSQINMKADRPEEKVYLSKDLRWVVEWPVRPHRGSGKAVIKCDWHANDWGVVVPPYVVNYLSAAANAHMQQLNDVAMALLSIATEATLRDVLSTRGYSFVHGAPTLDVYAHSDAHVSADVAGNRYLVEFGSPMPRSVSDFSSSFATTPVPVKVRRVLKDKSSSRIDLQIIAPKPLHEHWSTSTISQAAAKSVGGLGAALDVARNIEKCVTAADLAEDFDTVLQAVRNNLVHLSGDALKTHLPQFDDLLDVPGEYTLRHYLGDGAMVGDFVVAIPRFVTDQYVKLRQQNFLFS